MGTQAGQTNALLQHQVDLYEKRIGTIEESVHAISTLANQLAQSHTIFDYKMDDGKRVSDRLTGIVDRMTEKGEGELRKTIELLDKREAVLNTSIVSHREIILREVEGKHMFLLKQITDLTEKVDSISDDLTSMQKWVWLVMGGAATLSFLAEKVFAIFGG